MGNGGQSQYDGHTPPQGEEGTHLEMSAVKARHLGVYVSPELLVANMLLI